MAVSPLPDGTPFEGAVVLDGVARRVVRDVNRFFSSDRLKQVAAHDERRRLANELHDGVLQALAGAVLQLEALSRTLESDPTGSLERLKAVQALIAAEQRQLRRWIEDTGEDAPSAVSAADLHAALEQLCANARARWSLRIELAIHVEVRIPRTLGDHVYRIVQEGLSNVGRHAGARTARVTVQAKTDRVDVVVSDDGLGFPFHGTYDLGTLTSKRLGPRSLKERVASLRGELVLRTDGTGSRLSISLPLRRDPWPGRPAARTAHYGHD